MDLYDSSDLFIHSYFSPREDYSNYFNQLNSDNSFGYISKLEDGFDSDADLYYYNKYPDSDSKLKQKTVDLNNSTNSGSKIKITTTESSETNSVEKRRLCDAYDYFFDLNENKNEYQNCYFPFLENNINLIKIDNENKEEEFKPSYFSEIQNISQTTPKIIGRKKKREAEPKPKKRKMKLDGMRKKFKVAHLNWFIDCVNERIQAKKINRLKLVKLNGDVIAKINIDFNRQLMKKTMYEIYLSDPVRRGSKKDLNRKNTNLKVIQQMAKELDISSLFNKTMMESTKDFLHSEAFSDHLDSIRRTEDQEYSTAYQECINNYIEYYSCYKANKRKNERNQIKRKKGQIFGINKND
jgi:hypothetical protein